MSTILVAKPVKDIEFHVGHGFYDAAFNEVISTETSGATIRYTLDGSDPCASGAARVGVTPVTVQINPNSTYGGIRPKTPAVTVRACGRLAGKDDSDGATQTYIFLNNVVTQSSSDPGSGWPSPNVGNGQHYDYGMDQSVAANSSIKSSLASVPSISLVTDLAGMFSYNTGIYQNADKKGGAWERPASVELIYPNTFTQVWDPTDTHKDGFQVNCGVRIRGGYSRSDWNPKHSFRIFMDKDDYGVKELEYSLFGNEGVDEFKKIDFRTAQNYSWSMWGDGGDDDSRSSTFLRDIFARDVQAKQGKPYTRSRYFHLYVNGMYWGLFMTQERAESHFAAHYFGDDDDVYDVVKTDGGRVEATDGNLNLFNALYNTVNPGSLTNADYFGLQGLKANGITNDPTKKNLLDPENLIEYMLGIYYGGDKDAPISNFMGNNGLNNFYGIISQLHPIGFKWFRHDGEHTLDKGLTNRTGPYYLGGRSYFNPQTMHEKLIATNEYKLLFSDLVYRNFYNHGPLTATTAAELMDKREREVRGPITAESARWGDQKSNNTRTKATWQNAVNNLFGWLPSRTNIVIQQLKSKGWFKSLKPPMVKRASNGSVINRRYTHTAGASIILKATESNSTIFYTIDGTDPRAPGGKVSNTALIGGTKVVVSGAKVVKSRIYHQTQGWSPLRDLFKTEPIGPNVIKFSEIHYKPDDNAIDETDYEFIEIQNTSNTSVSLAGAQFSKGVIYSFPGEAVLAPGEYFVIAKNPTVFKSRYGYAPNGHYGGKLSNSSEPLEMVDVLGVVMDFVEYDDGGDWPEEPDGDGPSLNITNLTSTTNSNDPSVWSASYVLHGTPGIVNPAEEPYLVSVTLDPANSLIGVGSALEFTAEAINQYGTPYSTEYTWSVDGDATIVDGVFTAPETGVYIVVVAVEGYSVTARVEVQAAPVLASIALSPATTTVKKGSTRQFTVVTLDQYGAPFNAPLTWTVTGGGSINNQGLFTAAVQGTYVVTATSGAYSDASTITVTAIPTNVALHKKTSASSYESSSFVSAKAVDGNNATRWSSAHSNNQWIAVDLGGAFDVTKIVLIWETAASARYIIQVSDNGSSWTTVHTQNNGNGGKDKITIPSTNTRHVRMFGLTRTTSYGHSLFEFKVFGTPAIATPVLSSIVVTPKVAIATLEDELQYTAQGYDQLGNAMATDISWSVSENATINQDGYLVTNSVGSAVVTAQAGGVTGTSQLTINDLPVLTTITLSPEKVTIYSGSSHIFIARAYDQYGVEMNEDFNWSATDGTMLDDGRFIAYGVGIATVTAEKDGIIGTAEVTVIEKPILSTIEITPGQRTLMSGLTLQYSAVAYDQYGNEFIADFSWDVGPGVTISPEGLVTAALRGDYIVTVTADAVVASATLTVTSENLILNGDFSNGWNNWFLILNNGGAATRVIYKGKAIVKITNGGTVTSSIQLGQSSLTIKEGSRYRLSFMARAASNRTIDAKIAKATAPYTYYGGKYGVPLTKKMTYFSYDFVASTNDPSARLVLNTGKNTANVKFKMVKLVELP